MTFISMAVPLILTCISLYATGKGVDLYSAFLKGAAEGLTVILKILPSLIGLLTVISMIRASGFLDLLADLPLLNSTGIPSELLPLMLIRPLSGSGALSIGADLMTTYGADSLIGRTASVMLGSTETTFYIVAVYFGACGITKTRYAIPAALCADFTSYLLASWTVQWLFYS